MSTTTDHRDPEDMFADTRMSFGDHLEELRLHLWRAITGFGVIMVLVFILDGVGTMLGIPMIGVGKPAMGIISKPVEDQLWNFYKRRLDKIRNEIKTRNQALMAFNQPEEVQLQLERGQFAAELRRLGVPVKEPEPAEDAPAEWIDMKARVPPLELAMVTAEAQRRVLFPPTLSTLSVQEAFMVYFKVSIFCGLILASPWVFWQIWSFIAAGLYPHEKRYVHLYLPFSLGLFLLGVAVCELLVLPRAVEALLWFNEWIGLEPDLRLNEWLVFAIVLPLIFGVSFQTPLVMYFLERIGIMTVEAYRNQRKMAFFVMAVFAAIITPTPDALTLLFLWVPMCALFELGILMCWLSPRPPELDLDEANAEQMLEV